MIPTKTQVLLLQKAKKIAKEGQPLTIAILVWQLQISCEQATELLQILAESKSGSIKKQKSLSNSSLLQKAKKIAEEGEELSITKLVWRLQISCEQAAELLAMLDADIGGNIQNTRSNSNDAIQKQKVLNGTNLLQKAQKIIDLANQEGKTISVSLLKQKMNISYKQAAILIQSLVENNSIRPI